MKTWMEQQEEIAQARGEARGEARGALRAARADVLRVLEVRLGTLPPAVIASVEHMEDLAALEALLTRAATATSLADAGPA